MRKSELHPFLFGLYFVLALAAANARELSGWSDLAWPTFVSLLTTGLFYLVGLALARAPGKAALLALLWLVVFSVYGYVAETLRAAGTYGVIGAEAGLGLLFGLALFGPSLAIRRSARALEPINRYVAIVGLLLACYTTVTLSVRMLRDQDVGALLPLPTTAAGRSESSDRPDIYLIVLDKYTGNEALRQRFGFDNGDFERFLESRGFVVPASAQANYPLTLPALASMLNLDYLHSFPEDVDLYDAVENNRLAAFLQSRGYRFAFFPTGYRLTNKNRAADVQLDAPKKEQGEFAAVWVATTALPELMGGACAVIGCEAGRLLARAELAQIMDWKFDRMKDLAGGDRPTFVLAHLLLPHEPYLYHADCSHREPYWPAGFGLLHDSAANRGYLDQIRCANRKLEILVDSILARSRRPPVVLLQADHGHGRFGDLPLLARLNPDQAGERLSVFAAYYAPGVPRAAITDSVTPVNALRLVLRHYFQADLPPLEDASFWPESNDQRQFTRIR